MYLVELRPGKEELYRSGDELAAAIRSGDVDQHSRIYHRATSKWISVTLHPAYKAIVSEHRPAAAPLPPLERQTWTFFNDPTDELAGAHDPEPPADDKSDPDQPWRRPLALSITGGLLILGLQLAASGPRPPWSAHEASAEGRPQMRPASVSAPVSPKATVSLASNWTAHEVAAALPPEDAPIAETPHPAPAPVLPAAPKLRAPALMRAAQPKAAQLKPGAPAAASPAMASPVAASPARGVESLVQRWSSAHNAALVRLESGMRVARLNQLFGLGRLSPGGGVTETRMSLAGLANFVRVYRQQQSSIEREYQDSFTVASKAQAWTPAAVRVWYTKPAIQEAPEASAVTSSVIAGIDSLFGVLDAQAGTYTVTKNTIRFEDPSAARAYAALRARITAALDSAKAAGAQDQAGPMSYLLQAIGSTRLPLAI
jgi:hypothetical protein